MALPNVTKKNIKSRLLTSQEFEYIYVRSGIDTENIRIRGKMISGNVVAGENPVTQQVEIGNTLVNPFPTDDTLFFDARAVSNDPVNPIPNIGANDTFSFNYTAAQFDGVTDLVDGDIVLLNAQAAQYENGVWEVIMLDFATKLIRLQRVTELRQPNFMSVANIKVQVSDGTLYKNTTWYLVESPPVQIGFTSVTFRSLGSALEVEGDTAVNGNVTLGLASEPNQTVTVNATMDLNTQVTKDNSPKQPVRVASTGNIPLFNRPPRNLTDGIEVFQGDRVLLWQQDDPRENGIWVIPTNIFTASKPTGFVDVPWVRATDMDAVDDLTQGFYVPVNEGTLYEGKGFQSKNNEFKPVFADNYFLFELIPTSLNIDDGSFTVSRGKITLGKDGASSTNAEIVGAVQIFPPFPTVTARAATSADVAELQLMPAVYDPALTSPPVYNTGVTFLGFFGPYTLDGVQLQNGDTILVKNRGNSVVLPFDYTIWGSAVAYETGDIVLYTDGIYYQAQANNTGDIPPSVPASWSVYDTEPVIIGNASENGLYTVDTAGYWTKLSANQDQQIIVEEGSTNQNQTFNTNISSDGSQFNYQPAKDSLFVEGSVEVDGVISTDTLTNRTGNQLTIDSDVTILGNDDANDPALTVGKPSKESDLKIYGDIRAGTDPGLVKDPVVAASIPGDIPVGVELYGVTGITALDGVTLKHGMRVLVKDDPIPAKNGIWIVQETEKFGATGSSSGLWLRATDANQNSNSFGRDPDVLTIGQLTSSGTDVFFTGDDTSVLGATGDTSITGTIALSAALTQTGQTIFVATHATEPTLAGTYWTASNSGTWAGPLGGSPTPDITTTTADEEFITNPPRGQLNLENAYPQRGEIVHVKHHPEYTLNAMYYANEDNQAGFFGGATGTWARAPGSDVVYETTNADTAILAGLHNPVSTTGFVGTISLKDGDVSVGDVVFLRHPPLPELANKYYKVISTGRWVELNESDNPTPTITTQTEDLGVWDDSLNGIKHLLEVYLQDGDRVLVNHHPNAALNGIIYDVVAAGDWRVSKDPRVLEGMTTRVLSGTVNVGKNMRLFTEQDTAEQPVINLYQPGGDANASDVTDLLFAPIDEALYITGDTYLTGDSTLEGDVTIGTDKSPSTVTLGGTITAGYNYTVDVDFATFPGERVKFLNYIPTDYIQGTGPPDIYRPQGLTGAFGDYIGSKYYVANLNPDPTSGTGSYWDEDSYVFGTIDNSLSGTTIVGSTHLTATVGEFSSVDDYYNGWYMVMYQDSINGHEIRLVTDYAGATNTFTLEHTIGVVFTSGGYFTLYKTLGILNNDNAKTILLTSQEDPAENGIYAIAVDGTLVRTKLVKDSDGTMPSEVQYLDQNSGSTTSDDRMLNGTLVKVRSGGRAGHQYVLETTAGPDNVYLRHASGSEGQTGTSAIVTATASRPPTELNFLDQTGCAVDDACYRPAATFEGGVLVKGGLNVLGNTTYVQSINTTFYDNIIQLSTGVTGATGDGQSPLNYSGIEVDKSLDKFPVSGNPTIIFDRSKDLWLASEPGYVGDRESGTVDQFENLAPIVTREYDATEVAGGTMANLGAMLYDTATNRSYATQNFFEDSKGTGRVSFQKLTVIGDSGTAANTIAGTSTAINSTTNTIAGTSTSITSTTSTSISSGTTTITGSKTNLDSTQTDIDGSTINVGVGGSSTVTVAGTVTNLDAAQTDIDSATINVGVGGSSTITLAGTTTTVSATTLDINSTTIGVGESGSTTTLQGDVVFAAVTETPLDGELLFVDASDGNKIKKGSFGASTLGALTNVNAEADTVSATGTILSYDATSSSWRSLYTRPGVVYFKNYNHHGEFSTASLVNYGSGFQRYMHFTLHSSDATIPNRTFTESALAGWSDWCVPLGYSQQSTNTDAAGLELLGPAVQLRGTTDIDASIKDTVDANSTTVTDTSYNRYINLDRGIYMCTVQMYVSTPNSLESIYFAACHDDDGSDPEVLSPVIYGGDFGSGYGVLSGSCVLNLSKDGYRVYIVPGDSTWTPDAFNATNGQYDTRFLFGVTITSISTYIG
uniref:Uncharacterized protein n=1 Tax=viral metagenome TaxID=1070528 RepID=A0A6C0CJA5_9ZZZZ